MKIRIDKDIVEFTPEHAAEKAELEARALALENGRRKAKGLELLANEAEWEKEQKEEADERLEQEGARDLNTQDDALLTESGYILIDMADLLGKQSSNQVANF